VYLDIDVAYSSPSYGNVHVYQNALMPPNIRNVTYGMNFVMILSSAADSALARQKFDTVTSSLLRSRIVTKDLKTDTDNKSSYSQHNRCDETQDDD
jgi:hypothetical protein